MFYRLLAQNFKLNRRLFSNRCISANVSIIKNGSGRQPIRNSIVSFNNKVNICNYEGLMFQNFVNYCTQNSDMVNAVQPVPVAEYNEIKDLPNHPKKLLIDVREPNELIETGQIPTSINIPLGDVQVALSDATATEAFISRYGHSKPNENDEIIFNCRIGMRSEKAANMALKLGYSNVKNYKGSWLDWAEREGLPIVNYSTKNEGIVSAETVNPPVPVVEYDEIKNLANHPEKLLIDVREPKELIETGQIPTSINIPLGDVQVALSDVTTNEAFKSRYGHSKPNENDQIIFSCRSGVRAEKAANIAIKSGYSNVKNYKGSWLDWAEHEGLPTST